MIDLTYAKKKFEEYLKLYDIQDDKIRLKKVHTFAVLKTAEYICKKEKMSQEDTQLIQSAKLHPRVFTTKTTVQEKFPV